MDPAIAQALQQMQQQMQIMQAQHAQQIQQLQGAAAAAAVAVAHAPAAAAAPPAHGGMRIAPPAHYDGDKPALDDWLAAMRQQFAWYGINTDAGRVGTGAAHLAGPAFEWWEHPLGGAAPVTWMAFEAGLRARFQPITSAEAARAKLFVLVQGRSSINDYVAAFRRLLVSVPNTDADTALFQFLRGLNDKTREQIRAQGISTLDAAITMAVRVGTPMPSSAASSSSAMDLSALLATMQMGSESTPSTSEEPVTLAMVLAAIQQSGRGPIRSHGSGQSNSRGAQGASGGYSGPRPLPRIKGFSDDKVRKYMAENRCFGCDKVGHGTRECPSRRVDASGNVTWTN
jgi:hypothetical protein